MPSGPVPDDPAPFGGFHQSIVLTKDEVLDLTTALEEDLGDRDLLDQAETVARVRQALLSRLEC